MSKKTRRRRFSYEEKAKILSEHLIDKKPISEVCEAYELQPSLLYEWLRRAAANLALALEGPGKRPNRRERELEAKVEQLQATVAKKTGVIAEIAEELVALKKSDGAR